MLLLLPRQPPTRQPRHNPYKDHTYSHTHHLHTLSFHLLIALATYGTVTYLEEYDMRYTPVRGIRLLAAARHPQVLDSVSEHRASKLDDHQNIVLETYRQVWKNLDTLWVVWGMGTDVYNEADVGDR